MTFIKKIRLSTTSIIIVALACFVIDLSLKNWEKYGRVIEHDVHWYYFYLPAEFIYNDIKLEKSNYQFKDNDYLFWPTILEDGRKVNKTTMGLAVLYSPFFFAAHIYASYSDYPENGFSEPYKVFLLLSAIFYLIIGLDFLRKVLWHYNFSDRVIALTILLLGLGTNLLCYASQSGTMSHVYNFCLFSVFIYCTIKWHAVPSIKNTLIIGLLLGIISLIRPSNALIFIFFALYNISNWNEFKQRLSFFRREAFLLNLIFFFALLVWIPQFLYWKTVTGNYLYYSYTDEGFFFNHPRILEGLFSFRKGWLLYTPMMAFSLIGLFLWKNEVLKRLRLSIILFMALNIYIIFSWWCWWYGGTFGQRSLVESYALLAIPFACFVNFVAEKKLPFKILFYSICGFFIWLNVFQMYQYQNYSLHWEGETKELYFKQFGKMEKIPDFDSYVSWPNYDEAKKGNRCDIPAVKEIPKVAEKDQGKKINIMAANGKYLCADETLKSNVVANRDQAGSWEEFYLITLNENECAIRSNKLLYLSTELNQQKEITATRKDLGAWETFTFVDLGNSMAAFKAVNGKYLSLDKNTLQILAIADSVGEQEKFKLIYK
jgi:hypothetical protein